MKHVSNLKLKSSRILLRQWLRRGNITLCRKKGENEQKKNHIFVQASKKLHLTHHSKMSILGRTPSLSQKEKRRKKMNDNMAHKLILIQCSVTHPKKQMQV